MYKVNTLFASMVQNIYPLKGCVNLLEQRIIDKIILPVTLSKTYFHLGT